MTDLTNIEKTTIGLAKLVKHKYPNLKYDRYGIFYIYKGDEYGYYEALDPKRDHGIYCLLYETFTAEGLLDRIKTNVFREVAMVLKLDPALRVDEMDADHDKVGMLNGVFNVKTGELLPHSKDHNITMTLNVNYDMNAECQRFEQFLQEVLNDNQIDIDNLIMIGGFILFCNDPLLKSKVEKMFIFVGDGSNGKSILIRVFRSLFHREYISSLSLQDLTSSSSNPVRAPLLNSRLNICSEGKENDLIRGEDELKKIISGEEINIKQLYSDVKEIRSKTKVVQASNHMPAFADFTHSLKRRLVIIRFNNTYLEDGAYERQLSLFGGDENELKNRNMYRMDRGLIDVLMNELPGIYNLFYRGYKKLLANKLQFVITPEMEDRLSDDMYYHNPVYNFINNFCEIGEDYNDNELFTPYKELYDEYVQWYKNNWQEKGKPATPNTFSKLVRQLFPSQVADKRIRKNICINTHEWDEDKREYETKLARCINIRYVGDKRDESIEDEGTMVEVGDEQFDIPF